MPLPPEEACCTPRICPATGSGDDPPARSKLPETVKGAVVESIVEVKGMPNRIRWTTCATSRRKA
ncbi:hypothetical protein BZL30_6012 [Mycobacterium kansasii]|uniref:Uncharacterized protein n=1 Tax=Mycobacterium kansasii TaxID=1768 RepID=A0A1V3WUD9_MYCKA|nr:hypothetical protein BZL30_6012 [Mycobacterium kansasii]